ncbi:MAG: tetratricopeptide repeat protein [Planctomycetota bacterium]
MLSSHQLASIRFLTLIALGAASVASTACLAQESSELSSVEVAPVVARMEMRLAVEDEVLDVIEKGDLLTVLRERENDYVIVTHDGTRGAIAKDNVARIPESVDIYDELIEENPDEGRYHTLRASAFWALKQTDRALADFDRAIELGYDEAHAFTSRGLFHAEMGRFEKALADYAEALKRDPDDVAPIINRAAVHMSMGKPQEAIVDYNAILDLKPDSIAILRQRALAFKAAGKSDEAVADFDRILVLTPEDRSAVMGRGYVYFQTNQHEKAIEDFSRAIEMNDADPVAYNNRGYNRMQLGAYAEAAADYERAIDLAPSYGLALQNRAWLLATTKDESIKDPKVAVAAARRACELSNYENVGDLSALAASLAADGQFEEAIGWQEKVVENVDERFREFSRRILKRYQDELPFTMEVAEDTKDPSE